MLALYSAGVVEFQASGGRRAQIEEGSAGAFERVPAHCSKPTSTADTAGSDWYEDDDEIILALVHGSPDHDDPDRRERRERVVSLRAAEHAFCPTRRPTGD